jgi:hypothetical protein
MKYKKYLLSITNNRISSLKQFYASSDIDLINQVIDNTLSNDSWKEQIVLAALDPYSIIREQAVQVLKFKELFPAK